MTASSVTRVVPLTVDGLTLQRLPLTLPRVSTTAPSTLARLQHHRAVLASAGITDLSALGKLSLSGTIVPQRGIAHPVTGGGPTLGHPTVVQSVFRLQPGTTSLVPFGGPATLVDARTSLPLPSTPRPEPGPSRRAPVQAWTLPIDVAYWAASWIDLADGTTVVLKYPNQYLVIITEKLTVGNNVTFTWERPQHGPPPVPGTPLPPPGQPTSTTTGNVKPDPGLPGVPGTQGGPGADGFAGPELELWVLDMAGSPAFDLRGQDGFQGGQGGNGAPGGDGAAGRPDAKDAFGFCKSGPGNGGDGGPGGRAGDGGPGGNGGHGGKLSLFAPQPVLTSYSMGFFATVDGGAPGPGGLPGLPGPGGVGGPRGDNSHGCQPANDPATGKPEVRSAGMAGAQGAAGNQGPPGQRGDHWTPAIDMQSITAAEWKAELDGPHIVHLTQAVAKQGDTVTATGNNFGQTDVLLVDGVVCPTTVFSDTQASFQVPSVPGGVRPVQLRRTDGTLSNRASLYIQPTLTGAQPAGRIAPGSTVQLTGTGFAPGILVRVNDQDMPQVTYKDPTSLSFTLVRPTNVTPNAAGEVVSVKIVLPDQTADGTSNAISLTLRTFRILVLGDSIQWGQGLQEQDKIHSRVEAAVKRRHADIGVYKTVLAHSGAIIGLTPLDTTVLPALNGEVPTAYPTILEQAAAFTDPPEDVDLILLDGGINDLGVATTLNPATSTGALTGPSGQFCHLDMRRLPGALLMGDPTLTPPVAGFPNATVIVTGYYPILSDKSDAGLLEAFAAAVGLRLDGIPGAVVGGVVAAGTKAQMVAQAVAFATGANAMLALAVSQSNPVGAPARAFFANPMFGPDNAALAPNPFVFGIHADLSPEDPASVAGPRAAACASAGSRTDGEVCKRASTGHPNVRGAVAYAAAVVRAAPAGLF